MVIVVKSRKLYKKSKLVYGIGLNDADYVTQKFERINGKQVLVWKCPFYNTWTHMLSRCYSEKYRQTKPTYRGCLVCKEWLVFSNFKAWMESQDYKGKHLDKDLLIQDNKVYSPESCVFVDQKINSFTIDSAKTRGKYLIGVDWFKPASKFRSLCSNPFTNRREHLGLFDNELQAHLAWKQRKHELANQLADTCSDEKLAIALRSRYLV